MSKVIVIANRKGGCGKTMTTASLGIGLAEQGKKTLIIDVTANTH
jgi:chromosome partitioning protein